ncbi:MAG: tryptophan-rich sensory protein [Desulfobacteraceae bacterium]|nr:MAG: tryptophan-rich sensory protein [Desulfobacteraceae bacterium]
MTKSKQVLGLIGWLLMTFIAAGIGSMASSKAGAFYQQLIRPEWAPPAWIFGPVWTMLYLLMGIAAWLVWRAQGFRTARIALSLYMIQLALNALWTWLFFVWHLGEIAFIEIIVLWVLILGTLIAFWRVRIIAGVLLIPYLAWVGFASVLTYAIWKLNSLVLF